MDSGESPSSPCGFDLLTPRPNLNDFFFPEKERRDLRCGTSSSRRGRVSSQDGALIQRSDTEIKVQQTQFNSKAAQKIKHLTFEMLKENPDIK